VVEQEMVEQEMVERGRRAEGVDAREEKQGEAAAAHRCGYGGAHTQGRGPACVRLAGMAAFAERWKGGDRGDGIERELEGCCIPPNVR
jgi:hypothetical protein